MDPKLKIDLMIILFIIILSYVFVYGSNNSGGHNCQMKFIAFGLCILVAHKISYKLMKSQENYVDMTTEINNFIEDTSNKVSQQQSSNISDTKLNQYISAIDELKTQLSDLNNKITTSDNTINIPSASDDVIDNRMNVQTQQALQAYQIDYLKKQIEKTKELVNANKIQSDMAKYKPIKVYSSCAISNADGSLSALNQPTNINTGVAGSGGLSHYDSIGPINPSNSQLLSTVSQSTPLSPSSSTPANQNNFLNQVLAGLSSLQGTTVKIA
jgi:hypothetical protein